MRNPELLKIPLKMVRAASSIKTTLPRFPVPVLQKTLDRYLKSAKPFLTSEERCRTEDIIKKFGQPGGVGEMLQEKLNSRSEKFENWLEEWWINSAYLEYRDPVVIYSSPGLVFPPKTFCSLEDQLEAAAKLTSAALGYKKLIDEGKIPTEMFGKSPLDMAQYYKIFGTNRQPWKPKDKVLYHPNSEHIVVLYRNNFFKVQVMKSGNIIKPSEMLVALKEIAADLSDGPAVGILTSENRDRWADVYEELNKDSVNACTIKDIEESLFILCIDTKTLQGYKTDVDTTAANLVHGGGSVANSSNRWNDKTIQFIIGKDSGWGLNYEHSPAEGQAIARLMDHIIDHMECESPGDSSICPKPTKLTFCLNDCIQEAIQKASTNLGKITGDLEFNCIKFTDFGKNAVKKLKVSPDSFIQIAMQYAFYRIHKTPAAHYETGSTRMFIGGRTETIRSCSEESVSFARAMLDSCISPVSKARALLLAISAHKEYTLMAMTAQGVDRHFLGLRKIAAQECVTEGLEIFQDEAWKRSTHMRISSSQVAAKCDGFMIYGPLVHDGYACCYNPQDNAIFFGTTAWRSSKDTNLIQFGEALQESLREMRALLEKNPLAKL
uniref:Carnitine O-acetyltransferase n=1 Tax=Lygus hesperus TaxID=30085 RepID=A0A146KXC3_LYGHE